MKHRTRLSRRDCTGRVSLARNWHLTTSYHSQLKQVIGVSGWHRADTAKSGSSDKCIELPRKKAMISDTLVSRMLGPTRPKTRPICCSSISSGFRTSRCTHTQMLHDGCVGNLCRRSSKLCPPTSTMIRHKTYTQSISWALV